MLLRPLAEKQIVQSRNSEPLSDEEETAFREIAAALAEEAAKAETAPSAPVVEATEKTLSDLAFQSSIADSLARNAAMIFDRLGIGILISRDDVPIYTNRFLLDFLGYADEDAFHAAGGMARIFEQVRTGGDTVGLRTASGEIAAVRGRLQMIDWDGMPATLITLRPDEEKELRNKLESEMRGLRSDADELTAILDTATDGLALIDGEGRILALNRSAEALFGYYDQADVVGKPFTMLIARESQEKAQQYFEGLKSDAVASLLNDGREVIGQPRQGGTIPIFLTLGRIGAGSALKYCALLRDMTHWKKVEQELDAARRQAERASALKSDFLAKVSHEIRTPLNAILGFAEVIMEERFGPIGNERYRDYLKDIHTSGAHVMSLVNDLLDLSKIEAGPARSRFRRRRSQSGDHRMRRPHAAAGEQRARHHAARARAASAENSRRRALAPADHSQSSVECGEVQRAGRPGHHRDGALGRRPCGDPHPRHGHRHVGGRS